MLDFASLPAKNKNKHHFCIGWTGKSKRTNSMVSGRINITAKDFIHAEQRVKEFYQNDYAELEVYGTHLVYDEVA